MEERERCKRKRVLALPFIGSYIFTLCLLFMILKGHWNNEVLGLKLNPFLFFRPVICNFMYSIIKYMKEPDTPISRISLSAIK